MSVKVAINGIINPVTFVFENGNEEEVAGELTGIMSLNVDFVLESDYGGVRSKALQISLTRDASHAVEADLIASRLLFADGNAERNEIAAEILLIDDAAMPPVILGRFTLNRAQVIAVNVNDSDGNPLESVSLSSHEWNYVAVGWENRPLVDDPALLPVKTG